MASRAYNTIMAAFAVGALAFAVLALFLPHPAGWMRDLAVGGLVVAAAMGLIGVGMWLGGSRDRPRLRASDLYQLGGGPTGGPNRVCLAVTNTSRSGAATATAVDVVPALTIWRLDALEWTHSKISGGWTNPTSPTIDRATQTIRPTGETYWVDLVHGANDNTECHFVGTDMMVQGPQGGRYLLDVELRGDNLKAPARFSYVVVFGEAPSTHRLRFAWLTRTKIRYQAWKMQRATRRQMRGR